jgi:DNA (cytosine-5)-methyltransferase 3A
MKLNVLSLFDGMSCGQQALERCGIEIENYYASEIDKYAIQVTMANYPNTIQLGSVVGVDGYKLPKIDLLIGGSPCQSFSFAGKRKGMATKCETEILTLEHYLELKAEGYEFEGQSYLFWEFMRLLNECKPKYFLLENVEMGEKWEKVLSKSIGVNGIHINSALVSAQNRKRIYWTNIGMQPGGLFGDLVSIIEKPKDKGILLKDVLQDEVDYKYYLKKSLIDKLLKYNERQVKNGNGFSAKFRDTDKVEKMDCLKIGGGMKDDLIVHNMMPKSGNPLKGGTGHLTRNDGKTYCLDTGNTNAVEIVANGAKEQVVGRKAQEDGTYKREYEVSNDEKAKTLETNKAKNNVEIKQVKQINPSLESGGNQPYQQNRIYDTDGITPALCANKSDLIITSIDIRSDEGLRENKSNKAFALRSQAGGELQGKGVKVNSKIRRLTPTECERLQTVKDNYTNHVSDSQRYKMLGNGWTIDVIAHIFNYLK